MSMQSSARDIVRAIVTAMFPAKPNSMRMKRRGHRTIRSHINPAMQRGHISLLPYRTKTVQDFIRAIKYENDTESINTAADILLEFLREECLERGLIEKTAYLICTIPATTTRKRNEGYSHMHRILDALCRNDSIPAKDGRHTLMWKKSVKRQSSIRNRKKRSKNVANMLHVRHPIPEKTTCIVIDDVTTTGATLSEAKRALVEAGAHTVLSVALAR